MAMLTAAPGYLGQRESRLSVERCDETNTVNRSGIDCLFEYAQISFQLDTHAVSDYFIPVREKRKSGEQRNQKRFPVVAKGVSFGMTWVRR